MESEACLLYTVSGRANLYGTTDSTQFSTGDSILMKCGNFISEHFPLPEQQHSEAITVHFFPETLLSVFSDDIPDYLKNSINTNRRVFQKIESQSILQSYMTSLMVYFDNPAIATSDAIKIKLKELIGLLYELDSHGVREILSDLFNPQQVEFKSVIATHIYNNLSLDDFSNLLNLSVSSFRRKFKEIYGKAPGQYFMEKKLEKAANMLLTTDDRVGDICYDSGFGDVSNFSKHFTKHYSMSPTDYRKNNK